MSKNRGIDNFKNKLTELEVLDIFNSSLSQRVLADKYKVSQPTISRIKTKKLWKHLETSLE
jgi:predicted transcriptional regulator